MASIQVKIHRHLVLEEDVADRTLRTFGPVIFLAAELVQLGHVDAELLGVLLAVVDEKLRSISDVLGDPVVDDEGTELS